MLICYHNGDGTNKCNFYKSAIDLVSDKRSPVIFASSLYKDLFNCILSGLIGFKIIPNIDDMGCFSMLIFAVDCATVRNVVPSHTLLSAVNPVFALYSMNSNSQKSIFDELMTQTSTTSSAVDIEGDSFDTTPRLRSKDILNSKIQLLLFYALK